MDTNKLREKQKEDYYLEQVDKLANEMLHLSYQGLKELKKNKHLVICGLLRDFAFKMKQILKEEKQKIGG